MQLSHMGRTNGGKALNIQKMLKSQKLQNAKPMQSSACCPPQDERPFKDQTFANWMLVCRPVLRQSPLNSRLTGAGKRWYAASLPPRPTTVAGQPLQSWPTHQLKQGQHGNSVCFASSDCAILRRKALPSRSDRYQLLQSRAKLPNSKCELEHLPPIPNRSLCSKAAWTVLFCYATGS